MSRGFTLAETLVTIGITGIATALTMPSLIANHKEKEITVKLKKSLFNNFSGIYLCNSGKRHSRRMGNA